MDEASRSEFCLSIPGDTPSSRREVEVALAGCLPIFVARGGVGQDPLPLSNVVAWERFSLFFSANATATSSPP